MARRDAWKLGLLVLGVAVVVAGVVYGVQQFSTVTVESLMSDSRRYEGRMVTVRGTVREAVGVGATGIFLLDDGTGEVWVCTTKGVPRMGDRTTVRGKSQTVFVVDDQRCVVIMEDMEELTAALREQLRSLW